MKLKEESINYLKKRITTQKFEVALYLIGACVSLIANERFISGYCASSAGFKISKLISDERILKEHQSD